MQSLKDAMERAAERVPRLRPVVELADPVHIQELVLQRALQECGNPGRAQRQFLRIHRFMLDIRTVLSLKVRLRSSSI